MEEAYQNYGRFQIEIQNLEIEIDANFGNKKAGLRDWRKFRLELKVEN